MANTSYGTITITDTTDLEWFYGTDLTHNEGVVNDVFIEGASIGSMYLNTELSLIYKCIEVSSYQQDQEIVVTQTWQFIGDTTAGLSSTLEDLQNAVNATNQTIEGNQELISEMSQQLEKTQAEIKKITTPITISDDENDPYISVKAGTENANAYILIEENRLSFHKVVDEDGDDNTEGDRIDTEVLYIDSTEEQGVIDINNARVHQSIRIGLLEIFQYDNGIAVRRS